MNYRAIYLIFSLLPLAFPARAEDIKLCGRKAQGQILTGFASNAEEITFDGKNIKIAADGKFMLAFSRNDSLKHKLTVTDFDRKTKEYVLDISSTAWDVQKLTGIEQKKVTPSKQDDKEINRERADIRNAQKSDSSSLYWQEDFIIPVDGRTSGNFGGQRIMNGKKMDPHMGMDIAATSGTPVKAPADGVVVLSGDNNYFYSGNVIIIDHGYNLYTIYAHLQKTAAKKGETVKKGDIIGTVGKTGRVTGPHLHWGASLEGTRFDPKSLLEKDSACINL